MLSPSADPNHPTGRRSGRRDGCRGGRGPRRGVRRSWLWLVAVGVVLALVGVLAASAGTTPATRTAADSVAAPGHRAADPAGDPSGPVLPLPMVNPTPCALTGSVPLPGCTPVTPTPTPSLPLPLSTGPSTSVECFPGSLQPQCFNPTTATPAPTGSPVPSCTGEDCIPQPVTTTPNPGAGTGGGGGDNGGDCSLWDPSTWLDCLFRGIVTDALNPLLDLLGKTLLTTPMPDSIPQLAALWTNSWQILLASYGLLVLIGGIVVMTYQTLHTRYSIKEIAPRVILGFLAGTLSLFLATKAIEVANALAYALLGGGVDASSAAGAFRNLALNALTGGVWILFIGLVLAVMVVVLLVTYLVRVAITFGLIAAAPLLLMFHALPQTEGLARWWWKAFGGVLAIQLGQSLVLTEAMNALLAHGPASLFGG